MRLSDGRTSSERRLKSDQIAVRIGDDELLYTGFLVTGEVPLAFELHEQFDSGTCKRIGNPVGVGNGDLEVDTSAEWRFKLGGDPVPAHADLFEHYVRCAERDVREPLFRSGVADLEPANAAPELDASINIGHK
ncbi:hypothetical protein IWX78_002703 [Mycetocola sp. CAN_C7]